MPLAFAAEKKKQYGGQSNVGASGDGSSEILNRNETGGGGGGGSGWFRQMFTSPKARTIKKTPNLKKKGTADENENTKSSSHNRSPQDEGGVAAEEAARSKMPREDKCPRDDATQGKEDDEEEALGNQERKVHGAFKDAMSEEKHKAGSKATNVSKEGHQHWKDDQDLQRGEVAAAGVAAREAEKESVMKAEEERRLWARELENTSVEAEANLNYGDTLKVCCKGKILIIRTLRLVPLRVAMPQTVVVFTAHTFNTFSRYPVLCCVILPNSHRACANAFLIFDKGLHWWRRGRDMGLPPHPVEAPER